MSTPTPNEVSPPRNFPARLILILSTLGGTAVCLIMALGVLALFLLSSNHRRGTTFLRHAAR